MNLMTVRGGLLGKSQQKSTLNKLYRVPLGEKHDCNVSENSFSKKSLPIHTERTQQGETTFECDEGGEVFKKPNLSHYQQTYAGKKPYENNQYGRSFWQTLVLP